MPTPTEPTTSVIHLVDVLTIAAIFLGPIVAIRISEILQGRREAKNRKLELFKRLMATRAAGLSGGHVEALNLIDIEFRDHRNVLDAWKAYHDHLNTPQVPTIEAWVLRSSDFLTDLLAEMGTTLAYSFDKTHIRRGAYYPRGYGEAESDHIDIRRAMLQLLAGNWALRVETVNSPDPETAKKQQALGNGLRALVAGEVPLRVTIEPTAAPDRNEEYGK